MDVIVAKYAGFCPGVKRAAEIALGEAKRNSVATYGPLVHNTEMIRALEEQGVGVAENLADIGQDTIVIRSHGVGAIELEELKATGKQVVDATCPHVGRIHRIAAETDRFLIIVGDPRHPEVKGIAGWAKSGHAIVPDARAAREVSADLPVAVVAQTTFQEDEYAAILEILKEKFPDLQVHETICPATRQRQQEVAELSRKVDMMLVIGGKHSANTQKLVKICLQSGVVTHHIQTKSDVDSRWFRGVNTVGIAAGASTPEWIIREVVEMVMDTNNEGIEEVKEDTNAILEQQSKPLAVGDIVVGTVVQVNPDEVLVDVGYKMEGLVRKDELSFRKVENCAELVSVGDELEAEVTRLTDDLLELSARKAAQGKAWKVVKEAFENQTPVTGKVVEVVKGGLIVDLGLRGFMPASLVDLRFVEDLSQFVGQEVTVLVIELEKRRNKVIVSRKAYLMQEAEAKKAETLANLEEGTTVKGIVRRLTNFGAFVDIGGIDGLVHISELAHHRVEHPSEVLTENQEIEVFVLKVDKDAERVSLSLKHILPDPWTEISSKFKAGDVVEGKVVRLADFGAFVELIPGVDGLVHVSQISEEHVEKPEDVLSVGQEIKVKILDIDTQAKRVSLSMREAQRTAKKPSKEERPQDSSIGATIGERLGNLFETEDES
ncbi:MAG: bifunctional 4-hydroxy-3-methylbut-2-enyl diphosphate reductase/30S ribosomal protein S1 [Bacillota bacterium]|jgi:4-hydroxy-3-methylbut-2-enyl diphosphate reductase